MGQLLYYDGLLAVVDYEGDSSSLEPAIQLLLQVDPENPDIDKHVKPLLECYALFRVRDLIARAELSDEQIKDIEDNIDADGLLAAGVDYRFPFWYLGTDERLRFTAYVPSAIERISLLAESIQYLARLYLFSVGDDKAADILPEIDEDENAFRLVAQIPRELCYNLRDLRLPTQAEFDRESMGDIDAHGTDPVSVPVTIKYSSINMFRPLPELPEDIAHLALPEEMILPKSPEERRQIVAACLLAGLADHQRGMKYRFDREPRSVIKWGNSSFTDALMDSMLDGKVASCPYCGKPVDLKRKSSKPFCKPSHQTRYSEKARAAFRAGATPEEVAEQFPHINPETIRNWNPREGR